MGALMPQFKAANPALVDEYRATWTIVDATGGGKKPEPPTPPPST